MRTLWRESHPDLVKPETSAFVAADDDVANRLKFIDRLIAAGWPVDEAEQEYDNVQRDTEGDL